MIGGPRLSGRLRRNSVAVHCVFQQQTVTAYESGRRRMPVSSLPFIARFLGTTIEELMGEQSPSAKKRGPAPLLQQKIERLTRLPKAKQKIVLEMLDGVLNQASR